MIEVNNLKELINTLDTVRQTGKYLVPQASELNINFDIKLPIKEKKFKSRFSAFTKDTFRFEKCHFNGKVTFINNKCKLYIQNCKFNEIVWDDAVFEDKVRFHVCEFRKKVVLNNATFKQLADFWSSTFNERVIFYKVNFEETTVLSACIFNKNILFTYSLIKKLLILRGTTVKKGLDLSLAIIEGKLAIFDFTLGIFKSVKAPFKRGEWLETYDGVVADIGDIPTNNKRETYRIIKNQLISQKNTIDATKFSYLESRTHRKEVFSRIFNFPNKKTFNRISEWYKSTKSESKFRGVLKEGFIHIIRFIYDWLSAIANYILLSLNRLSNRHGTSYVFGIIFTLVFGALFYYLSVTSTSKYELTYAFDWEIVKENISGYVQFLIPTHRFTYLNEFMKGYTLESGFYIWDILGRIFIGYGIYQTIQAFRKYK